MVLSEVVSPVNEEGYLYEPSEVRDKEMNIDKVSIPLSHLVDKVVKLQRYVLSLLLQCSMIGLRNLNEGIHHVDDRSLLK